MNKENERYNIADDLIIEVVNKPDKDGLMMEGIGVIIMGGEEKNTDAKKGSPEEYAHTIKDHIEFKDGDDLELFEIGLKLIQQALMRNDEEKENGKTKKNI